MHQKDCHDSHTPADWKIYTTELHPGHIREGQPGPGQGKDEPQTLMKQTEAVGQCPVWFEGGCRSVVKHLPSMPEAWHLSL